MVDPGRYSLEEVWSQYPAAVEFIRSHTNLKPRVALILGSGLGVVGEEIAEAATIPYSEIPEFPAATIVGHEGNLVLGTWKGCPVVAMQGRFHRYEGYSLKQVTFPVLVMHKLEAQILIVTNAAGGINRSFSAGDLMLITDHINLMGDNPLQGPNDESLGLRFPDMSQAYDPWLRSLAQEVASQQGLDLRQGIYAGVQGPTFETPAEIGMLRAMGADAVGMSTVPEVIVANYLGMRVLGLSCITNMAAGILPQPLSHEEVLETSSRVMPVFIKLISGILAKVQELL
ncbi:purine-nucleoside phosphorylase [Candidatus Hakubella thermalkaliphila]|uniref:Purine nucleoside phosphorylase n=2 Tax=Candidatus Hakubella thermalkaliphila TaxID=2754717 RepID=A0A6V8PSB5_9ACTN|nr:purine-nucleoside phosphorylase [Candidatus Hakubella thermalkaliphila]